MDLPGLGWDAPAAPSITHLCGADFSISRSDVVELGKRIDGQNQAFDSVHSKVSDSIARIGDLPAEAEKLQPKARDEDMGPRLF
jgi:hypothetical protein